MNSGDVIGRRIRISCVRLLGFCSLLPQGPSAYCAECTQFKFQSALMFLQNDPKKTERNLEQNVEQWRKSKYPGFLPHFLWILRCMAESIPFYLHDWWLYSRHWLLLINFRRTSSKNFHATVRRRVARIFHARVFFTLVSPIYFEICALQPKARPTQSHDQMQVTAACIYMENFLSKLVWAFCEWAAVFETAVRFHHSAMEPVKWFGAAL